MQYLPRVISVTTDESHSHERVWICDAVVLVIQADDIEAV